MLRFEDYLPNELLQIAMHMLDESGLVPSPEAEEYLKTYLAFLYDCRDKYFGNARTVRNVVNEAIKNQNLRLAAIPVEDRGEVPNNLLTLDDLESFKLDKSTFAFNRQKIGFKAR
jgi:hypothetical protein